MSFNEYRSNNGTDNYATVIQYLHIFPDSEFVKTNSNDIYRFVVIQFNLEEITNLHNQRSCNFGAAIKVVFLSPRKSK